MAKKFTKKKGNNKLFKSNKQNFGKKKYFPKGNQKNDLKQMNKNNSHQFSQNENKDEIKVNEEIQPKEIINIDEINNRPEEIDCDKILKENNNINKESNEAKKDKIEKNDDNIKKEKNKTIKNDNNDNMKEIFIRNIGYSTTEEKLKDFFSQIIPESSIEFCLLCKDKETKNSKGSAFIKLTKESYNKVMSLYKEYSTKKRNFFEMNPFELEGRYLKLFDAMKREELKNLENEKNKKNAKRNKTNLYYGLSKETICKFKEYENITQKDKEKRESLIKIKKENFYNNPNFHVSETRLTFRNLDKNIDEKNLKEKINNALEEDENIKKEYKNMKLIKQIKVLRENDDKSKCVAFVECLNFTVAKYLIDNLSGKKLNENSQKGLIIDFSLDDFRKKLSRQRKLERIKEIKKKINMEKKEKRRIINKEEQNKNKIELKDINDINKLIDLYHTTMSRGKKQRIKKKLKKLGYNKNIPPVEIDNDKNTKLNEEKNNAQNKIDNYVKIKITNNRTELNKKMKNKLKLNKEENNKNFINKKRKRENQGFGEDENIQKKKIIKDNKKLNDVKNVINEKMDYINKRRNNLKNDDEDEDSDNIIEYYNKIKDNLTKKK